MRFVGLTISYQLLSMDLVVMVSKYHVDDCVKSKINDINIKILNLSAVSKRGPSFEERNMGVEIPL